MLDFNIDYELLCNREYLTDGTNAWIHVVVMNQQPVVINDLKPECEDDVRAINEIEEELLVHSKLHNWHICAIRGRGLSTKGTRFIVLERLDGGTLGQLLGYKAKIRDRRKRFARRRKKMSSVEVLKCALAIAEAMDYCHQKAVPGSMAIHRDLALHNTHYTILTRRFCTRRHGKNNRCPIVDESSMLMASVGRRRRGELALLHRQQSSWIVSNFRATVVVGFCFTNESS